uniref:chloride channel CLIC-like protein 1 n=1 Tax=Centroberyx gerrardi TaxID=166262 RepID=UPI003AAE3845
MFSCSASMRLVIVLVCSLALAAMGQQDDDWIDPYDMLNYDASTKTMRKPAEPINYPNVPTKRREYSQDSGQVELTTCNNQVVELQKEIEDQKKKVAFISQQPTCNPVFKRFLTRLLKEMERVGLPSDQNDVLYDAKVRLSRQAVTEIRKLLEGEESWRTGALDDAVSQILVDFKAHDREIWRWNFEDTFGVEIDTVLKIGLFVMIIVAIICTQLWSVVSWFVQFRRLFAICFFISIVWNWFYLYKIAFAEHQNNIVKLDSVNEKCTGVRKIDWSDSLKEWFRSTWTLQDDPCKRYYEVLMVNPILLVPPTKAISVTITTFITEPLKHFGQGISEFLRALLKDLPVTLQIPVLLTIVLSILVVMYGSVQAAFQHGITAPLRRGRREPPPPPVEQPQPQPPRLRIEDRDHLAGGDAPQYVPRPRANQGRADRPQVRQRGPNRAREGPAKVFVETLRTADPLYRGDEADVARGEEGPDAEQLESLSATDSDPQIEGDSDDQQEAQEELTGASARNVGGDQRAKRSEAKANSPAAKAKPTKSNANSSQAKAKPLTGDANVSQDKSNRDSVASKSQPNRVAERPAGSRASQTAARRDAQVLEASAEDRTSSVSVGHVETVGSPVQETEPTSLTR